MNYIVFDLEATCWKDRSLPLKSEIIEIGALKIDRHQKICDEFSKFVRPKMNPKLSDFCKELTTIRQEDIDEASPFPEVITKFQEWIGQHDDFVLCSWGFYDKKQLRLDCDLHHLPANWTKDHISLKHQFAQLKNLKRPIGMGGALKMEGLKLEGTHHRGIDDARNIAKIFVKYFDQWNTGN